MSKCKSNNSRSFQETGKIQIRLMTFVLFLIFLVVAGFIYQDPRSLLTTYSDFSKISFTTIGYWVAVLLFIVAMAYQINQLRYARLLDREDILTLATISKLRSKEGADSTNFILTYTYLTNLQADTHVSSKYYYRAREGDQVRVFYLPKQLTISRLDLLSIPERSQSWITSKPTPIWDDNDHDE